MEALKQVVGHGQEDQAGATPFEREIAQLVIDALRLDIRLEDIDVTAPLFGGRLGLDSIDMLEIALAVSKSYGVEIRSDDVENKQTFASLRELAKYVASRAAR